MTAQERIAALQCFGYDEEEARFLSVAALHSGYFLRRQYLSFIGGTKGWKDVLLIKKLKVNRHCRITVYRHNRMVYHLSAKPLYAALGEQDNRNRREHQISTIKNKLMGLDFVLEHPSGEYLATEREKLNYFVRTLKIGAEDLPTRWYESPRGREAAGKHFVEKYPMFLAVPSGEKAPVVHFCYIDEGLQSTDRFATFLEHHSRLLTRLSDYRVIYVAEHDRLVEAARGTFEKSLESQGRVPLDPETRELLDYFEARHRFETRDFSGFDTARIIRFREEKKRFVGGPYEALYSAWQAGGAAAVLAILHPDNRPEEPLVERFSTYVLNHDYDLFGTLTSRSTIRTEDAALQTQPHC